MEVEGIVIPLSSSSSAEKKLPVRRCTPCECVCTFEKYGRTFNKGRSKAVCFCFLTCFRA